MNKQTQGVGYGMVGITGAYLANRATELYQMAPDGEKIQTVLQMPDFIHAQPWYLSLQQGPILASGAVLVAAGLVYAVRDTREYAPGREHGDARWGTARELKSFKNKKDFSQNIILGQGAYKNFGKAKFFKKSRNNNVIVIGGSGAGKTESFIWNNLMQMNSSYLLTDPKGTTARRFGKMFQKNGYKVREVNFDTLTNSDHFNPFAYIKDEITLKKVIRMLIDATNAEHEKKGEPFWDKSEEMLITALMGFLYYRYRGDESHKGDGVMPNLADMGTLIGLLPRKHPEVESQLEFMFKAHAKRFGSDNFAYIQWRKFIDMFKDKTRDSVLAITVTRFSMFDLKQVREFIADDNLEIDKWASEKYAVFLKIPDLDDTFNFLPLMVFLLAFRTLEHIVDNEMGGEAKVPVQFLMDEFVNLGKVPNIKEALSVFRSRLLSIVIVLQSMNQMQRNYKDSWKEFFGNADSWVYLSGSTEPDTQEFWMKTGGKKTVYRKSRDRGFVRSEPVGIDLITYNGVSELDRGMSLVKIASVPMFKVPKYHYLQHPKAKEVGRKPGDKNWWEPQRYRNLSERYDANMKNNNQEEEAEEINFLAA